MNGTNYSDTDISQEELIKQEAQNLIADISEAKAKNKELVKNCGITGREDINTLKTAASEGNIVAEYYLAMQMKAPGSAPGEGFDYNTISMLKDSADGGFGPAAAQYGIKLLNENNNADGLNYVIDGAKQGDDDAIYALADFYYKYASEQRSGSEEYKKYLTASALWYRVGLALGVEMICLRSENYNRIINLLNKGGETAKSRSKSKPQKSSGGGGIAFNFDKRIIIVGIAILLIVLFLVLGIFFIWPMISGYLGGDKESDPAENAQTSMDSPDASFDDTEDFDFSYSESEDAQVDSQNPVDEIEDIPEDEVIDEVNQYSEYIITAKSGLHLRTEPSTDADSLVVMDTNDIILVEFIENGWAKVRYGYLEGWCKADYIALPVDVETGFDYENSIGDMYVIAKSGLRLRSEPDLDADKIILMPYGSKVTVYDVSDPEWYGVEYIENGRSYSGWCSREYLDISAPTD